MTLRIGIDIGTSGVRCAALDPGDRVVARARVPHLPQGSARIDAKAWWTATKQCLHKLNATLREAGHSPADVTGLAVDGTSGSMVLTDGDLTPVSEALMYNSKGFGAEAARIADVAPARHITQGSNSALGRAMRLCATADGRPRHLMHQADFIAAKLTGRAGVSDPNNALKTGYDPETGAWPEWIGALIDPALLPRCVPVGTPVAEVAPRVAAALGLPKHAVVHAGTTDSIAAFLASAPLRPGVAVTSLGSTLAIKILSETRLDDPEMGLYSHRVGNVWLAGGASNTGGAVLAAYFDMADLARLSDKIDLSQPSGLDYYPLLTPGERFPVNDPELPPRLDPRPVEDHLFLQGMLEAMARIEADCYRVIETRGGPFPTRVLTAGGGAQNPVWTALRAEALGVAPQIASEPEASVGVAKLAG